LIAVKPISASIPKMFLTQVNLKRWQLFGNSEQFRRKDLGKKWFAFSRISLDPNDLIRKLDNG